MVVCVLFITEIRTSPPANCLVNFGSSDSAILYCFVQEGEKWDDGPCKVCECRGSQVTCYEPSCSPCPVATLAQVVKGRCCPDCTSGGSLSDWFLPTYFYCQKIPRDLLFPVLLFFFFSPFKSPIGLVVFLILAKFSIKWCYWVFVCIFAKLSRLWVCDLGQVTDPL